MKPITGVYVAKTHHKKDLKIYVDRLSHTTFNDLKNTLNRSVNNRNVIDYEIGEKLKLPNWRSLESSKELFLAKLETFLQKNKFLTGYYRSKTDKELQNLSKEIFLEHQFSEHFKETYPNATKHLQDRQKGLIIER